MSLPPLATFTTNTDPNSLVTVVFGCEHLWAMGQCRAIEVLSIEKYCPITGAELELVRDFSARAARIAAAYARFYLELEEGCNPDLKGRFYWMGLAAFASKQVMCGLDFVKELSTYTKPVSPYFAPATIGQGAMEVGKDSLGKGNFWLFQDIYVWHWFYANYPEMFAKYSEERDASKYPAKALDNLKEMPWAEEALTTMSNFSINDHLRAGFNNVAACEQASPGAARRKCQFDSLMDIADHEQRMVLQPLIYNNVLFKEVLNAQQAVEFIPWFPQRLAAFSAACDVDQEELKVRMEEGNLYDENSRMKFIGNVAARYHFLMEKDAEYMGVHISAIASWDNAS